MAGKKQKLSQKDRFFNQASQFQAYSRLFEQGTEQTLLQLEKERVLAKVCAGLHEVCKMLANAIGGKHEPHN